MKINESLLKWHHCGYWTFPVINNNIKETIQIDINLKRDHTTESIIIGTGYFIISFCDMQFWLHENNTNLKWLRDHQQFNTNNLNFTL